MVEVNDTYYGIDSNIIIILLLVVDVIFNNTHDTDEEIENLICLKGRYF